MGDTIVLNGLAWDTENLVINGKTHFAYEEAKAEAAKLGKRLPTKSEFEALLQLNHVFDEEKHGMWFAENQADLKSDKSLFLKAAGCIDDDRAGLYGVSTYGYYWSNTGSESNRWHGYYLYFGNKVNGVAKDSCSYGFSVLCVSDIKKTRNHENKSRNRIQYSRRVCNR